MMMMVAVQQPEQHIQAPSIATPGSACWINVAAECWGCCVPAENLEACKHYPCMSNDYSAAVCKDKAGDAPNSPEGRTCSCVTPNHVYQGDLLGCVGKQLLPMLSMTDAAAHLLHLSLTWTCCAAAAVPAAIVGAPTAAAATPCVFCAVTAAASMIWPCTWLAMS